MACTYGVLAGTLVGAATLAFEDRPSDNLNKVARGASIGLYTGILMGLYVLYLVPDGPLNDDGDLYPMEPLPDGVQLRPRIVPKTALQVALKKAVENPVLFHPMINPTGAVDGFGMQLRLVQF